MLGSRRHLVSIVALAGLATAPWLCANAETLDELYAKAKPEGNLVLYVGGPTAPWEAMAKQFEQRYPGIKFAISGGFSNVLDKKIDAQIAQTNSKSTPQSCKPSRTSCDGRRRDSF